jgi:hypothetical protein
MLKKEYYCLVASLSDLFFNESKTGSNCRIFKEELSTILSNQDNELVKLMFLPFDNENLLSLWFNLNKPYNLNANLSKNYLELQLSPTNEDPILPKYMLDFIAWIKNYKTKELNVEIENTLYTLYFEYVLKTKNEFLRNWFLFELNLKNILTTFNCIKYGYELTEQLIKVKPNHSAYSLLINKRLKPQLFEDELPFSDSIFKIAESDLTLIEKEKALDKIKWEYLDEFTFFHYFTIEKIISYIVKLMIIERWINLDKDTGTTLLNRLINDLKISYEFPDEFKLTKKTLTKI